MMFVDQAEGAVVKRSLDLKATLCLQLVTPFSESIETAHRSSHNVYIKPVKEPWSAWLITSIEVNRFKP
jgi:hypothetical protein